MSYYPTSIPTLGLTDGRRADPPAEARSAGAVDDQRIGVAATDEHGNAITAHEIFIEIDC